MIKNLVIAHLRETFTLRKILIFILSLSILLVIRLYMFTNDLKVMDQTASLIDWVLYSVGGPVGHTRLLNGVFFLILLFIVTTLCRPLYEKNAFIYSILLTKANSRFSWITSIFLNQLIVSFISVLITITLSFLLGSFNFDIGMASFFLEGIHAFSYSASVILFFSIVSGVWFINCLMSAQHLFPEIDLSNQAVSVTILMLLLLLHVYFPILDNINPIAYASLSSLISYGTDLKTVIFFRLVVVLVVNTLLTLFSVKK